MNILLIAPRMGLRPMDSEFKRRLSPPLGLLTVAALTPKTHKVSISDENAAPLKDGFRPDLVGITANVNTAPRAYAISRMYRERGVPVVLGGIHPSANPEEALQHADAVCIGEADAVWTRMVEDAQRGVLKGIYRGSAPADLARTPEPRWALLDRTQYLCTNVLCATRGCPHRCEFCYNSCDFARRGHRAPPVSRILHQIAGMDTRHVLFIDDNLIGNIRWARELVRALTPLGLTWHAAVSADLAKHPDLIEAMARSGCKSLFIGFESINPAAVQGVNKRQNRTESYEGFIQTLHRHGILVNASLVFGFDEDGPGVFQETLSWLIREKIASMTAHILTPYPGTALFKRLQAAGRIDDFDWAHYDTAHVVYRPLRMSKEELRHGYLRIYREFYSFKSILRRMPQDRNNWIPFLLFNLVYRKFGKVTSLAARAGLSETVGALVRRLSYGIG